MKKALLIIDTAPNDVFGWSGTNYYIGKTLSQIFNLKIVQYTPRHIKLFYYIFKHTPNNKNLPKILDPYPLWYRSMLVKKFLKSFNLSKYDYIFSPNIDICAFSNYKTIHITDSFWHQCQGYSFFNVNKKIDTLYEKIYKHLFQNTHGIIVSSNWAADDAIKHYNAPPNKVLIAPFGANIPYESFKRQFLSKKKKDILFVGIDHKRKGLDYAKEVIKKSNNIDSNHTYILHIVGLDGKNEETFKYYGLIKKDKCGIMRLTDLYKKCSIFFLPTKVEAAGIVFCEAQQYSMPIIATKTGGVPTYVKNNYNGYLIELGDDVKQTALKIIKLANNKKLYLKYSENALNYFIRHLNWNAWSNSVYHFLVDSLLP